MKITLQVITDQGLKRTEYEINGARSAGDLLAIDIVGIGWRTLEKADYSSYEISAE